MLRDLKKISLVNLKSNLGAIVSDKFAENFWGFKTFIYSKMLLRYSPTQMRNETTGSRLDTT